MLSVNESPGNTTSLNVGTIPRLQTRTFFDELI
jgi:hypothetical protein